MRQTLASSLRLSVLVLVLLGGFASAQAPCKQVTKIEGNKITFCLECCSAGQCTVTCY